MSNAHPLAEHVEYNVTSGSTDESEMGRETFGVRSLASFGWTRSR